MNSIYKLEFTHSDISEGDIVEVGTTKHLLTKSDENPCVVCSLYELCDCIQAYGLDVPCNGVENVTFVDITPHE